MNCLICNNESQKIFSAKVLGKYNVIYFKCTSCGYIQTEKPYWLHEAYSSAISSLDVGLVYRNLLFIKVVEPILIKYFNYNARFLDYAGGYGLFVRMMRDKGFDFYRQDMYCPNIFAQYLDIHDLPPNTEFELLTAFEVFEHLTNPLEEITHMLTFSDSILFSTELQPSHELSKSEDWWYFVPETGQHIAFYTKKSLAILAEKLHLNLYTNNTNLHILTSKILSSNPFAVGVNPEIQARKSILYRLVKKALSIIDPSSSIKPKADQTIVQLPSLLPKDFEAIRQKLNEFN